MTREHVILIIGLIVFSIQFFLFYPPTYGLVDEAAYLTTVFAFQKGTIFYDQAGIVQAPMAVRVAEHNISKYPPGNAVLLLPFSLLDWRLTFVRGYIMMVIGLWIFSQLLSHYRLSSIYALLFMFHPSFVLYSRTIMSDLPTAILTLIGVYFFIRRKNFIAGVFMGIGISIRYPTLFIAITLGSILPFKREWQYLAKFILGMGISIIPLILYNLIGAGSIFGPIAGYGSDISFNFNWQTFKTFFLLLIIIYPLLLIIPFFSRMKEKWLFIVPVSIFIIFYSFQSFVDTGHNFFESLIRGQRYMLPVIPLLLIPYFSVIDSIGVIKKIILPIAIILLLILSTIVQHRHRQFLREQVYYQKMLYAYTDNANVVICNKDIHELINPYIRYIPCATYEIRRQLQSLNEYKDKENVYLACLARDDGIKFLFEEVLAQFAQKQEIYTVALPYYFSIWRVLP